MPMEIHAANVASIQTAPPIVKDRKGMVLRARRILWGPKNILHRDLTLALDTADVAFILYEAVKVYGPANVVRAVMRVEQEPAKIPTEELEA